MSRLFLILPTAVAIAACQSPPEESSLSLQEPLSAPVPEGVERGWRRMDLEQLDASIRRVTNGIGWDDPRGGSQFLALSDTLGAADYLEGRNEDLSVGMLFLKFLEDAAGDVCTRLVERESAGGEGNALLVHTSAEADLQTDADGVRQNLADALLRFHGKPVGVADPELEPWVFLFDSARLVGGSAPDGWRTVCVGLLTHPDFYTY